MTVATVISVASKAIAVPSALNKAESRETPNMATTQAIK